MGCDIHVMVEAKDFYCRRKGWFNVDHWRHNPDYGIDDENEPAMIVQPIFDVRDYDTFAYLAGIRNYGGVSGFGFDRGIPKDVSAPTNDWFVSFGEDAHTPGYAVLSELKGKVNAVPQDERWRAAYLYDLIEAIDKRKQEIFWIHRPETDDGSCDDKIRIVFWFDN